MVEGMVQRACDVEDMVEREIFGALQGREGSLVGVWTVRWLYAPNGARSFWGFVDLPRARVRRFHFTLSQDYAWASLPSLWNVWWNLGRVGGRWRRIQSGKCFVCGLLFVGFG
mmetsp:Transcript_22488/g.61698  ORF Transcript_22488/g.61698 Transcript_22488/m.61698 type:complete len:113 (-) Transcript_22488:131-469(-)